MEQIPINHKIDAKQDSNKLDMLRGYQLFCTFLFVVMIIASIMCTMIKPLSDDSFISIIILCLILFVRSRIQQKIIDIYEPYKGAFVRSQAEYEMLARAYNILEGEIKNGR